ncbi:MAG: hypothetical protein U0930_09440 [Pirellulales bacterium]
MPRFQKLVRACCSVGLATALMMSGCATGKSSKDLIAHKTPIPNANRNNEQERLSEATQDVQTVAFTQQPSVKNNQIDFQTSPSDSRIVEGSSAVRAAEPTTHSNSSISDSDSELSASDLESFIATAMANNPAIRQAEAAVCKAIGFRDQVILKPNPMLGYNGSQLFDRQTDQHTMFMSPISHAEINWLATVTYWTTKSKTCDGKLNNNEEALLPM